MRNPFLKQQQQQDEEEPISGGNRCGNFLKAHWRGLVLGGLPVLLSPLLFIKPHKEMHALFTVLLMAIWWISEVIPLHITSCIPIFVFPIMGILDTSAVCLCYFKDALMLFFAGLVVALGIEYSNLHKRVALHVIMLVGCAPRKLHLSLSICTTFISMWVSNSAATAMMCPIIKAVLEELAGQGVLKMYEDPEVKNPEESKKSEELKKPEEPKKAEEKPHPSKTALAFYLSAAYCSSIGGCGTLIGTGTNVTFKGIYDTRFPAAGDVDFMNFMFFNLPPMILHMSLTILWLQIVYLGLFRPKSQAAIDAKIDREGEALAKNVIRTRLKELGPFSCHELQVAVLFILMIFLLIFRKPGFVSGWSDIFTEVLVKNSMPITLIAILLFVLPIHYYFFYYCVCKKSPDERETPSLLSWTYVQANLPWGLLLLLGGGFALAAGLKKSGLAVMLGNALQFMKIFPAPVVQLFAIVLSIILTAFSSNVAMCNIFVPILLEMAVVIKVHPGYLSLPACLCLSMAFHFPVSTPPNAIISGLANVKTSDMAFAGIGPSIVCIIGFFFFMQTWGRIIYPQFSDFPAWATS